MPLKSRIGSQTDRVLARLIKICCHFPLYSQSDKISKKAYVLNFIAQILENSADPGKQRPKWYDNFIYATIEGLSSKNENFEVEKAAALALSNGGHFIEKANAEQILDSVLLRYFLKI